MGNRKLYEHLKAFDKEGNLNAVVETPQGSRNKFKYNPKKGLFFLHKILPTGASFPFDYGFIPSTQGADGDPLDIIILVDEPGFTGCLVPSRLVGVIEADQTEDGKTIRNDRLIAVAIASRDHGDVKTLKDLNPRLLEEIEHFFISYNDMEGKEFKPKKRASPETAHQLVEKGMKPVKKAAQAKA